MRITLPDDDAQKLAALKAAASEQRSDIGTMSSSAWVRGAITVADEDADVAARIAAAAPDAGHGGRRPGAGRPRKRVTKDEGDDPDGTDD